MAPVYPAVPQRSASCQPSIIREPGSPTGYRLNPGEFPAPAPGAVGHASRILRFAPDGIVIDWSVLKDFRLHERLKLS
jgi:hypothetical protein